MSRFYVSAVGADRPGIVSEVTRVLMEQGCNLEDSAMTLLRGQFAIMVLVDAPGSPAADSLEAALSDVAEALDLVIVVRPLHEGPIAPVAGEAWSVSVHGADRPGIVHRLTSALANAGANIVDLSTRVVGEPGTPGYVMVMSVTLPEDADPDDLRSRLGDLAEELGVHCSMHETEADIL